MDELTVKGQLAMMRATDHVVSKLKEDRGDAVIWVIIIIIGVILAVSAYAKFKTTGGTVGTQIDSMGARAATGLTQVIVQ